MKSRLEVGGVGGIGWAQRGVDKNGRWWEREVREAWGASDRRRPGEVREERDLFVAQTAHVRQRVVQAGTEPPDFGGAASRHTASQGIQKLNERRRVHKLTQQLRREEGLHCMQSAQGRAGEGRDGRVGEGTHGGRGMEEGRGRE